MTKRQIRLAERRPVWQATIVRSDVAHTFDVFVRTIGQWWPVMPISSGKERVRDVVAEPGVGGRLYEVWDDGSTRTWGEFVAWDPPAGFVLTWHASAEPTEVELTFTALGPALTRVAVEHRGWEALSEAQTHEDCAVPGAGGYAEGSYDWGWTKILASFAEHF